jgi:hypothetical protein
VYVIQGLLGQTFDVQVDGETVRQGVGPKAVVARSSSAPARTSSS